MMKYRILSAVAAMLLMFGFRAQAQNWAIGTNLAGYAALGTMNLELSYALKQHWSVEAGVRYNPFSFQRNDNQFQLRQRTFSIGTRWWPWHIYSGWWFSPKLQYMEYNAGGFVSQRTKEGDRIGMGALAGYTHMINSHLNLEFGAGFWGGYEVFTLYSCPTCGFFRGSDDKAFILPDDLIISLSYVF